MAILQKSGVTRTRAEPSSELLRVAAPPMLEGIKIFSATQFVLRNALGETVTAWLTEVRGIVVVDDIQVLQSSDAEFHCVTIIVFYRQPVAAPTPAPTEPLASFT